MSKVLKKLGDALPDERPLLSLQIVENVGKCPVGYRTVSRTYDEDADAGLLRQNGLFGKKPSHYICLSKSEENTMRKEPEEGDAITTAEGSDWYTKGQNNDYS
ncbi:hypothetical protein ACJJTC_002912 [Scirpophaga incertulas]